MFADILLSSGRDYTDPQQTTLARVRNTPERNLIISALLGVFCIAFWQTPLIFLQDLQGVWGNLANVSFAMYIGSVMVFHGVVCVAIHLFKVNEAKEKTASQYLKFCGGVCIIFALIYSLSMMRLGMTGAISMHWYHYLGLPLFTMIIMQFILGSLLTRVRYYSAIAGTLGMMTSLLLTVHLMTIQ